MFLYVHRFDEPMPLWLLQRPNAQMLLHTGTNTALHEQNLRAAARPHRHTVRDKPRAVQRHIKGGARRGERHHTPARHQGTRHTGGAISHTQRHTLQRADDGAHDSPIRRTRQHRDGPPTHGDGALLTVGTRLQSHTEGGAHHRRP